MGILPRITQQLAQEADIKAVTLYVGTFEKKDNTALYHNDAL